MGLLGDAWRTGIRVDQEGLLMNPICGQKAEHARNQGTTAVDILLARRAAEHWRCVC